MEIKADQEIRISDNKSIIDEMNGEKKLDDILIVNHPGQNLGKNLQIGHRAHINYNEAVLTVTGFESESQYLLG